MRALWLRDFQPWSQVIPLVLGVIALIIFAVFYFRRAEVSATILQIETLYLARCLKQKVLEIPVDIGVCPSNFKRAQNSARQ